MLAAALLVSSLQFHYDTAEVANAAYHLACLTGKLQCSRPVYTRFWDDVLHVTKEDGAQFDRWSAAFDRVEKAAPDYTHVEFLPNYIAFYPNLLVRQKLVATSLGARSPDQFRATIAPLVGPVDSKTMSEVLAHTLGRLHSWYTANVSEVQNKSKALQFYMRSMHSGPLISNIADFVKADFPAQEVSVHLVPSPAPKQTDASATCIRNHFAVEVTEDMKPEGIASIALHELTHALYDSARPADHMSLIAQFSATNHPAGSALYALLNEGLATAVQLLTTKKQDAEDKDVYRHPWIPRVGRSTMPVLKRAMKERTTILDGFVAQYIAAAEGELKDAIQTPQFQLATAGVITSSKNEKARDAFFQSFKCVGGVTTGKELQSFSRLPAVRLFTYEEQHSELRSIPDFEKLLKLRGFAFRTKEKGSDRPLWILAGRDSESLVAVIGELSNFGKDANEGVVIRLR